MPYPSTPLVELRHAFWPSEHSPVACGKLSCSAQQVSAQLPRSPALDKFLVQHPDAKDPKAWFCIAQGFSPGALAHKHPPSKVKTKTYGRSVASTFRSLPPDSTQG